MHFVFFIRTSADTRNISVSVHADNQHVRIVKAAGRGTVQLFDLADTVVTEGLEFVKDISCRAVHVRTNGAHPGCRLMLTDRTA